MRTPPFAAACCLAGIQITPEKEGMKTIHFDAEDLGSASARRKRFVKAVSLRAMRAIVPFSRCACESHR